MRSLHINAFFLLLANLISILAMAFEKRNGVKIFVKDGCGIDALHGSMDAAT